MRIDMAHRALLAGLVLACTLVWAQGSARPAWSELTTAQREALAPLASDWAALDAERKRKWLEVAAKYPRLSPEGKQKLHERMAEFSRLTPEQKKTARENFRRAYEVPAEQRQATVQKYQELPEDKKRELANRAASKGDAQRAPPLDSRVPPAKPPAKTEPQKQ
ncbi:MAG TPA: DUF3106 domain-containing protein [Burkholderiaceae bacterium]|nr:DUF3106 domain-containing protein [Burkholderiaceae bacterium]